MSRVAEDLSRHLSEQLGVVLERHLKLAAGAIGPQDMLMMMLRGGLDIVSSAVASAAMTAAQGGGAPDRAIVDGLLEAAAKDLFKRGDAIFAKVSGGLSPGDRCFEVETAK